MLSKTFTDRSRLYNVEMRYLARNTTERTLRTPIVFRSTPSENAVVATYTVTLYDSQTLTSPTNSNVELTELDTDPVDGDDGYYPIPNAIDGPVYNVVEVRVIVW
jgi:hypothetical protein